MLVADMQGVLSIKLVEPVMRCNLSKVNKSSIRTLSSEGKILAFHERHHEAVTLLKSIKKRAKPNLRFWKQLLQHQMDARDSIDVKKCVGGFSFVWRASTNFISLHFFESFLAPAWLGKTLCPLQQVWASVTTTPIVVGNQINSYEGMDLRIGQNICARLPPSN